MRSLLLTAATVALHAAASPSNVVNAEHVGSLKGRTGILLGCSVTCAPLLALTELCKFSNLGTHDVSIAAIDGPDDTDLVVDVDFDEDILQDNSAATADPSAPTDVPATPAAADSVAQRRRRSITNRRRLRARTDYGQGGDHGSGSSGECKSEKCGSEKSCICNNSSFDVAVVAAQCDSCLKRSGERGSDVVERIISVCGFSGITGSMPPATHATAAPIETPTTNAIPGGAGDQPAESGSPPQGGSSSEGGETGQPGAVPPLPAISGGGEAGAPEPAAGEPAAAEPGAGAAEPAAGEPGAAEPSAGEAGAGEPAAAEPSAAEPSAAEPGAGEAGAGEAGAGEPAATEPANGEPAAAEPSAPEPAAGEAGAGEPAATEPAAGEAGAGEPAATETGAGEAGSGGAAAASEGAGGYGAGWYPTPTMSPQCPMGTPTDSTGLQTPCGINTPDGSPTPTGGIVQQTANAATEKGYGVAGGMVVAGIALMGFL